MSYSMSPPPNLWGAQGRLLFLLWTRVTEMSVNYTCSCLDTIIVFFGTKFIEFILQHYCLVYIYRCLGPSG